MQKNALAEDGLWPLATQVLLGYENSPPVRLRAKFLTVSTEVDGAAGNACPAYVFPNDEDYGYGLFLLDEKSQTYIAKHLGSVSDVFERTLLWGALWDSVRAADMAPAGYLETALRELRNEPNETLVRSVGGRAAYVLHSYLGNATLGKWAPPFEKLALEKMMTAPETEQRILWFRTLLSLATTETALKSIEELLKGDKAVPGVELRPLDRWRMVSTLLAQSAPGADEIYQAECKRNANGIGLKYAYVAGAAKPDAATKKRYFEDYLHNSALQEDWVQDSLGNFNAWNADKLTEPYLKPALDALPQIKQERKIFFTMAWLNAFVGGQRSAAADKTVRDWLETAQVDPDLKLKVLQVVDDLNRTVRIRARFQ
jgi:aminopeptidase N